MTATHDATALIEHRAEPECRRHHSWTPDDIAMLVRMRGEGAPAKQIGDAMGLTQSQIEKKVARLKLASEGTIPRGKPRPGICQWSKDSDAALLRELKKGNSYSQIAATIGVSRSAIAGRIYRLGLCGQPPPRPKASGPIRPRRPRQAIAPIVRPKQDNTARYYLLGVECDNITELKSDDIPVEQRTSLLDLAADTCRWPCAPEGEPQYFCGAQTADGKPYCPGHCMRAYQPKTRKMSEGFNPDRPRLRWGSNGMSAA